MFDNQTNQRYNNNNNGVNVNTKLYSSYGDDSLLTVSGWNQNLSIKFHPITGTNADGTHQYATSQGSNTNGVLNFTLTMDSGITLLEGIEKEIIPAMENGKNASVSILSGIDVNNNRKLLTISVKDGVVSATYDGPLDAEGKSTATSTSLTHTFKDRDYYSNYDISTGKSDKVSVPYDFKGFIMKIKAMNRLTGETAHSIAYTNALKKNLSDRYASNSRNSGNYQAPSTNFSGNDMSEFLPFN